MASGEQYPVAAREAVMRTIPSSSDTETVGTSEVNFELTAFGSGNLDLSGKWVFFRAVGGDITIQRGTASPALVAGEGFVIKDGAIEELFVDAGEEMTCYAIASAAASTLVAAFSPEE